MGETSQRGKPTQRGWGWWGRTSVAKGVPSLAANRRAGGRAAHAGRCSSPSFAILWRGNYNFPHEQGQFLGAARPNVTFRCCQRGGPPVRAEAGGGAAGAGTERKDSPWQETGGCSGAGRGQGTATERAALVRDHRQTPRSGFSVGLTATLATEGPRLNAERREVGRGWEREACGA